MAFSSAGRGPAARVALTRKVSPALARCELTHLPREPIDVAIAGRQHEAYERALADLGFRVESLPAEPDLPDSVFVEDAAVVLEELAVITRPGAPSRRAEIASVASALEPYRAIAWIGPPGTLDGGDVLVVGRRVWVGRSARTNENGALQLRAQLAPFGYETSDVPVRDCLHLKSAVTRVGEEQVLVNPSWVDERIFHGLRIVHVDPAEPFAANALLAGDGVIVPAAHPRTRARLEAEGAHTVALDVSEIAKAEGGVTCCCLLFEGWVAAGSRSG
ncbi:MAG TPA: N(G),N(G)-dimethylarginine dimethylaminohydrolase [Terriglobales bacterium]|nr:N(G),N(G)-dimethylarginine dimethylaminohydrolase [Terriglobales bacterium]